MCVCVCVCVCERERERNDLEDRNNRVECVCLLLWPMRVYESDSHHFWTGCVAQ